MRSNQKKFIVLAVFGSLFLDFGAWQIHGKSQKTSRSWKVENRIAGLTFATPNKLKFEYTPPTDVNRQLTTGKAIILHQFQAGKVKINLNITQGYVFEEFFRERCGNSSIENALIKTENIARPWKGVLQERILGDLRVFALLLEGKQNHYLIAVAWPLKKSEQDSDSQFMTPEIAKTILLSFRQLSTRKDAGD